MLRMELAARKRIRIPRNCNARGFEGRTTTILWPRGKLEIAAVKGNAARADFHRRISPLTAALQSALMTPRLRLYQNKNPLAKVSRGGTNEEKKMNSFWCEKDARAEDKKTTEKDKFTFDASKSMHQIFPKSSLTILGPEFPTANKFFTPASDIGAGSPSGPSTPPSSSAVR